MAVGRVWTARLSGQTASTRCPTIKSIWKGTIASSSSTKSPTNVRIRLLAMIQFTGKTPRVRPEVGKTFLSAKWNVLSVAAEQMSPCYILLRVCYTSIESRGLFLFLPFDHFRPTNCSASHRRGRLLNRPAGQHSPTRSRKSRGRCKHVGGAVKAPFASGQALPAAGPRRRRRRSASRPMQAQQFVPPAIYVAPMSLFRSHLEDVSLFYLQIAANGSCRDWGSGEMQSGNFGQPLLEPSF